MTRRLTSLTIVALAIAGLLAPTPSGASGHDFPSFSGPVDHIYDPATLGWNPTGEFIFPTVISTEHIVNPLGNYYLYTMPHDPPGGAALFYADSLDGPWTEYAANPVMPNTHGVGHISSPQVMWNTVYNRYQMYFHGENDVTRWAWSVDGISWTYGGVSVTAAPGMHAASYARVYEYTIPRLGTRFVMVYTEQHANLDVGMLRIRYAVSNDGTTFHPQRDILVTPSGIEGSRISSPSLHFANGTVYALYHAASGNIHVAEVGPNFDRENHLGALYDRPERVASPVLVIEGATAHLFFEQGDRLSARIAHTSTPVANLAPLVPHSGSVLTGYFADVSYTSHYFDIYALDRAGITTGCGTPILFCPTQNVTRAEIATFLARAMNLPLVATSSTYVDVPPNTFYTAPVEALRTAGIISPGTHFRPNDPLTRQEMAVFMGRALGLTPIPGTYFVDVPQGTSFTGWIYAIYAAGITTGIGGGNTYNPTGIVTRQQMASFLNRGFHFG